MFDNRAIAAAFGKAAKQYDAHATLQQQVRSYALNIANTYWQPDDTVLDLGCGTGTLRKELNTYKKNIQLLGLDVSAGMCSHSAAMGLPVVQADSAFVPFAPATFDGVFSSLMLQWVAKPALVCAEITRILKPGGTAVVATLTDGTLKELKAVFATQDDLPHVSDFHVPHNLLCCAEEAGLVLRRAEQKTIIEHYPDSIALMRALKAIGANNKHRNRSKSLMTPAKLARLEQNYITRYGTQKGLPASWQVLILVLQKENV